jgi:hypothetical protein
MKLTELQEKLGEQIQLITDQTTPYSARKSLADVAMTVSSLAKQMINNADVVLRAEKLIADGKLKQSAIEQMVGKNGDL